jgi:hypothetical protein
MTSGCSGFIWSSFISSGLASVKRRSYSNGAIWAINRATATPGSQATSTLPARGQHHLAAHHATGLLEVAVHQSGGLIDEMPCLHSVTAVGSGVSALLLPTDPSPQGAFASLSRHQS